jgi:hypothetical protein
LSICHRYGFFEWKSANEWVKDWSAVYLCLEI